MQGKRTGKTKELKIGTWNIRTLYRAGAVNNLEKEISRYKLDVVAIQEVRWTGHGKMERKEHSIYYSCQAKKHEFGCGFVIAKKINHLVMDFQPIDWRICKIRLRGKFQNISIINVRTD